MKHDHTQSWQGAVPAASVAPLKHNRPDPSPTASTLPFRASKGAWFDTAIDFRNPEGDKFVTAVLEILSTVETRSRKRRPQDEQNHYILVRRILANGFCCHFHWRPHLVAYSRKTGAYRDGPTWLSGRALGRAVDLLVKAALLDIRIGEWGDTASVYHIKPKLYGIAQEHGVTDNSLTLRLPPERLVRVREGNSGTDLVVFQPNDDTRRWTALLDAYNAFICQQNIDLAVTPDEEAAWVRHWNGKRDKWDNRPMLMRSERFKTDLYRSFNNGSFDQGGRLYGAWWINTPKHLRKRITINGQPTVELDFSGCAIRMLYHEHNKIDYLDDPYRHDAITLHEAEKGLKPGHFREGIKAITQALINDCDGDEPERIPLPDGLSFRPDFKRREIRQMIEEKHSAIADAFGTGAGLRLQRKDSDLALAIITKLREKGIVALPIHDSFCVTDNNRDILMQTMNEIYKEEFGFYPLIKQDGIDYHLGNLHIREQVK